MNPDEAGDGQSELSEAKAKDVCLRLLTTRSRTHEELREAMLAKHASAEVADAVLARLAKAGLVDDAAFAQDWVRSRHRQSGLAPRALVTELRRKGVDAEVAQEAAADVGGEVAEQRARELVRKKLGSASAVDPRDQGLWRRLAGLLARKGYPEGLAYRVIREELEAAGNPDDPRPV